MEYVRLGSGGPKVSRLGLGLWQAGSRLWGWAWKSEALVSEAVRVAVAHGVNFFDTAEIYGGGASESILGRAVKSLEGQGDLVVASKVAGFRSSQDSILDGVRKMRSRLSGKLDLVQHHWPPPVWTDICNVVRGLERAVLEGLSSYYGFSNYPLKELREALSCSRRVDPVSNQVQYNLAYRVPENGLIGFMDRNGISLIAWSPLAKGALAGVRKPTARAQRIDRVFREASRDSRLQGVLKSLAEKYGCSRGQISLAWLISKGAIPIPGFRRPERVLEYVKSLEVRLGEGDLRLLDEVTSVYVSKWGREYGEARQLRLVPATLQRLLISAMGGI